jgi:hypothetical protein
MAAAKKASKPTLGHDPFAPLDARTEKDLRWYFRQGPNPKLGPGQKNRWVPIHRALNGQGYRLRRYIEALSTGRDFDDAIHASTTIPGQEPVYHTWLQRNIPVSRSALYAEHTRFYKRLESYVTARPQRGRPKATKKDHIVISIEAFVAAGKGKIKRAKHTDEDEDPYRPMWQGGDGKIDWSTWGGIRIGVAGSAHTANLLGIPNAGDSAETLDAIEAHCARYAVGLPKEPVIRKTKSARKTNSARNALYLPDGSNGRERLTRSTGKTITEISNGSQVQCSIVRALLRPFLGEICKQDRIPNTWLKSTASRPFRAALKAAKRDSGHLKCELAKTLSPKASRRNYYARLKALDLVY